MMFQSYYIVYIFVYIFVLIPNFTFTKQKKKSVSTLDKAFEEDYFVFNSNCVLKEEKIPPIMYFSLFPADADGELPDELLVLKNDVALNEKSNNKIYDFIITNLVSKSDKTNAQSVYKDFFEKSNCPKMSVKAVSIKKENVKCIKMAHNKIDCSVSFNKNLLKDEETEDAIDKNKSAKDTSEKDDKDDSNVDKTDKDNTDIDKT